VISVLPRYLSTYSCWPGRMRSTPCRRSVRVPGNALSRFLPRIIKDAAAKACLGWGQGGVPPRNSNSCQQFFQLGTALGILQAWQQLCSRSLYGPTIMPGRWGECSPCGLTPALVRRGSARTSAPLVNSHVGEPVTSPGSARRWGARRGGSDGSSDTCFPPPGSRRSRGHMPYSSRTTRPATGYDAASPPREACFGSLPSYASIPAKGFC
jgi:hypothetical protein